MKTEHTPEKWQADFSEGDGNFIITAKGKTVAMSNQTDIEEGNISKGEAIANGKLIAAAPDMLKALEEITHCFNQLIGVDGKYKTSAIQVRCKAVYNAIKNATE